MLRKMSMELLLWHGLRSPEIWRERFRYQTCLQCLPSTSRKESSNYCQNDLLPSCLRYIFAACKTLTSNTLLRQEWDLGLINKFLARINFKSCHKKIVELLRRYFSAFLNRTSILLLMKNKFTILFEIVES